MLSFLIKTIMELYWNKDTEKSLSHIQNNLYEMADLACQVFNKITKDTRIVLSNNTKAIANVEEKSISIVETGECLVTIRPGYFYLQDKTDLLPLKKEILSKLNRKSVLEGLESCAFKINSQEKREKWNVFAEENAISTRVSKDCIVAIHNAECILLPLNAEFLLSDYKILDL